MLSLSFTREYSTPSSTSHTAAISTLGIAAYLLMCVRPWPRTPTQATRIVSFGLADLAGNTAPAAAVPRKYLRFIRTPWYVILPLSFVQPDVQPRCLPVVRLAQDVRGAIAVQVGHL